MAFANAVQKPMLAYSADGFLWSSYSAETPISYRAAGLYRYTHIYKYPQISPTALWASMHVYKYPQISLPRCGHL